MDKALPTVNQFTISQEKLLVPLGHEQECRFIELSKMCRLGEEDVMLGHPSNCICCEMFPHILYATLIWHEPRINHHWLLLQILAVEQFRYRAPSKAEALLICQSVNKTGKEWEPWECKPNGLLHTTTTPPVLVTTVCFCPALKNLVIRPTEITATCLL